MKKKIAMLLTCSLLFTMMPAAFAGPGQGSTSDRARSEERARDRDRSRDVDRDRDRGRDRDRDSGRGREGILDSDGVDPDQPEDNYTHVQDYRGTGRNIFSTSWRRFRERLRDGWRGFRDRFRRDRDRNHDDAIKDDFRDLDPKEQKEGTYERLRKEIASSDIQQHLTNFVSLAARFDISLSPITIREVLEKEKSGQLWGNLTKDDSNVDYVQELDTVLKQFNHMFGAYASEGHGSPIADLARALSHEATLEAAKHIDKMKLNGFSDDESNKKLEKIIKGDYSLSKEQFQGLLNEVAIRKNGKAEVIPGAKYKTNIITINPEDLEDYGHYSERHDNEVKPILTELAKWEIELRELGRKNRVLPADVEFLKTIIGALQLSGIEELVPSTEHSCVIATSTYGGKMQAITLGTFYDDEYHIEYTMTAPHNLLAGDGSYQGAANIIVSEVIQDIFDEHPEITTVTTFVASRYNVKSRLKLGFVKE